MFLGVVEAVKSFTVRGIDDKLYDEIKKHSADKSLSINKFILSLLKAFGILRGLPVHEEH